MIFKNNKCNKNVIQKMLIKERFLDNIKYINRYKREVIKLKKIKEQKGAISFFVLFAMLFFLIFVLTAYTMISRRLQTQTESETQLQTIYQKNADEIINAKYADSKEIIPIYNYEQFSLIGSNEYVQINDKFYKLGSDKNYNYILKNNIIVDFDTYFSQELSNIELLESKFFQNVLDSNKYKIDKGGYDLYYYKSYGTEKAYFKNVFYQNSQNALFTEANKNELSKKSFKENNKYSILNELESYKYKNNYEFLLIYNTGSEKNFNKDQYNWWYQNKSPFSAELIDSDATTVTNVGTARKLFNDTNSWKNVLLVSNNSNTILDGSIGSTWWYSVGLITKYNSSGIPGFPTTTSTRCYLFSRVEL